MDLRDYNIHLASVKWREENHKRYSDHYKQIGEIIRESEKREDDKIKAVCILVGFVILVAIISQIT